MRRPATLLGIALILTAAGCGDSSDEPGSEVRLGTETTPGRTATEMAPTETETAPPDRTPIAGARPPVVRSPIPFGAKRRRETVAYAKRHYGTATDQLDPKLIVEHVTVLPTYEEVFAKFSTDEPDSELGELPQVCSHFVIDRDGTIHQLVPLSLICRHTVGLNDRAIGIEHVGRTDAEVLGNARQLRASLRLTTYLRCRHSISVGNVIGHSESLSSPYHHELVGSLRRQTHKDFQPASMRRYRGRLDRGACD